MNASLVDRLTPLKGGRSRRAAVRTAVAGAAAAVVGLLASGTGGEAKRKCKKKSCPDCPDCPACPTCTPLPIGAVCESTSQCCGTQTNLACVFQSGGLTPICCGTKGTICTGDTQCCDRFECFGGRCQRII
jgi:hypothetical protein